MPSNPVQIVLGTEQYMKHPDGGGGGGSKDFFEGKDADFVRHKARLLREVNSVSKILSAPGASKVGYVRVKLQSTALAKTHRPVDAIFHPNRFPLVGTGALGELIFEVTESSIVSAQQAIGQAEDKVTRRDKKEKLKASPVRSEVGAIQEISLQTASQKRKFTDDDVAVHFKKNISSRYLTIELFVDESDLEQSQNDRSEARVALRKLRQQLGRISPDLSIWSSDKEWKQVHITVLRFPHILIENQQFRVILQKVLTLLDQNPLVRQVSLGPIMRQSATAGVKRTRATASSSNFPLPEVGVSYPLIGVVDGGICELEKLAPWRTGGISFMNQSPDEREHGTFIAGLLVNGLGFNPEQPFESTPCRFFDFDLHCNDDAAFASNYPQGFVDMIRQLDSELGTKPEGLRVMNMSLVPEELTDPSSYSWTAAVLDEMADKHGVIFVVSAGNLDDPLVRARWPDDPTNALKVIAAYAYQGKDRVYQPGESARNLTVGALELIDAAGVTRPARYTRRGPATSAGVKPDFAHVGGCLGSKSPLLSIATDGSSAESEGTSFSAPMVARTLALLDHQIEGRAPRELLLAMMYHFARMPNNLSHKDLSDVVRDFTGFGIPAPADAMLTSGDDSITLIFVDTLQAKLEMSFDFTWPAALIDAGKSRGNVSLTLVYSPPLEWRHKSEFARVNLDAYLRQEEIDQNTGGSKFTGRLKQRVSGQSEKSLISHGAKWWPVKHYANTFQRIGGTSNWRLVVDSMTRAGSPFPNAGVPFALVLTITDPQGDPEVFADMRRSLISSGVNIQDVRTAVRVRT